MNHRIPLTAIAIAAATLSCSVFLGGPAALGTPTPIPPEDSNILEQDLESALSNGLQDGILTLTLDENLLTAYLVSQLQGQADPEIVDPRVVLTDDTLTIQGTARSGIVEAGFAVATNFSIDEVGQPVVHIVEADFGPVPVPQVMRNAIGALIQEMLTGTIGTVATGFRLESIEISDGQMTVTGRLRQ